MPTWRALAAAVAGVLTCGAFPPWGWWPLAFVGVAALALIVRGRPCKAAYGLGLAYSLGFLLPLLVWSKVAGLDAWLILTISQSLLLALIGPLCVLAQRRRFAPLWIAGAWMVEEAIRDRVPFGGFPWGRLAFSQSQSPLTGTGIPGRCAAADLRRSARRRPAGEARADPEPPGGEPKTADGHRSLHRRGGRAGGLRRPAHPAADRRRAGHRGRGCDPGQTSPGPALTRSAKNAP